jgi:hypothetical protein
MAIIHIQHNKDNTNDTLNQQKSLGEDHHPNSQGYNEHFDKEILENTPFMLMLPGKLRADKRLKNKFRLQVLVTEIFALAKAHGYAYCSDKYLSEKMGVSLRSIKYDIQLLEKFGYIKRVTRFSSFKKERKIYVVDIFSNNFYEGQKVALAKGKNLPNKESLSSFRDKDKERGGGPPPHTPPPPTSSSTLYFGEFKKIKLTQTQYDKLKDRFGEVKLKQHIERMDCYLKAHGKAYKDYYAALLNWDAKENNRPQESKKKINQVHKESAAKAAKVLKERYPNSKVKLEIHDSYAEIHHKDHPSSKIIEYKEAGFINHLKSILRKSDILID